MHLFVRLDNGLRTPKQWPMKVSTLIRANVQLFGKSMQAIPNRQKNDEVMTKMNSETEKRIQLQKRVSNNSGMKWKHVTLNGSTNCKRD